MHFKVQCQAIAVLNLKSLLPSEVFAIGRVYDTKSTWFEGCVLHIYAYQKKMGEFDDVDGADTAFSEEVGPILLGILIIDSILEVEWE